MRGRHFACIGLLVMSAAGGTLVRAGQQGVGQLPSSLPLTSPIRERGSSVSPAYEGWYYEKDGSVRGARRLLQPEHEAGIRHSGRAQ